MRWFLNSILVLAGLPLVGMTLVLVAGVASTTGDEIPWPVHLCFFAVWLSSLAFFALAYVTRTRWLERRGIYRSWSNFEAYVKENHWHPPVPEEEKTEFLSWAGLSEERPAQFRKAVRALYRRIHAEVAAEEQRRLYIKCLAQYTEGWPVHGDCYGLRRDCYGLPEDDHQHLTSGDA